MLTKSHIAAALAAAAFITPAVAHADSPHRYAVDARSQVPPWLWQDPTHYVMSGQTADGVLYVSSGTVRGQVLIQTTRWYYWEGVVTSRDAIEFFPDGQGGVGLAGGGRYVKGNGPYEGVTGRYTLWGHLDAGKTHPTLVTRGSMSY